MNPCKFLYHIDQIPVPPYCTIIMVHITSFEEIDAKTAEVLAELFGVLSETLKKDLQKDQKFGIVRTHHSLALSVN